MTTVSLTLAGNTINTPRIVLVTTIINIFKLKISFKMVLSRAPFTTSLKEDTIPITVPLREVKV
jgi:hypothetical protein